MPNSPNIRLSSMQSDGTSVSGLLEVRAPDGRWGTVCDDNFQDVDARVACHSLGLGSGMLISNTGYQTEASSALPILLSEVGCGGGEPELGQCYHGGWGRSNCGHWEDVALRCFAGELFLWQINPVGCNAVRCSAFDATAADCYSPSVSMIACSFGCGASIDSSCIGTVDFDRSRGHIPTACVLMYQHVSAYFQL